jgi:hypothetical protein
VTTICESLSSASWQQSVRVYQVSRDNNLWRSINALRDSNRSSSVKSNNESVFQWELDQVCIWSHHLSLYNFRSLLSADFAYKRWVRKKIFVCKKFFKKCNLRFSIAFERVEMMKNRSQLMFCVRVSQAAIQKQNSGITWCDYSHVIWLRWLCIGRDNFDSGISTYIESRSP